MIQEDYDAGKFDPPGKKSLKSGLVLLYYIPREPDWDLLDGPGF